MEERELLAEVAAYPADFLGTLDERPIQPAVEVGELRADLGGPLPDGPTDAREVTRRLIEAAEPGVIAIASGRFFGFVIGGELPAALAADWLTAVWDQKRFDDDDELTREVVTRVQADGTCFVSGTTWQGVAAMRISVCNWRTTTEDVERSVAAMRRVLAEAMSARAPSRL